MKKLIKFESWSQPKFRELDQLEAARILRNNNLISIDKDEFIELTYYIESLFDVRDSDSPYKLVQMTKPSEIDFEKPNLKIIEMKLLSTTGKYDIKMNIMKTPDDWFVVHIIYLTSKKFYIGGKYMLCDEIDGVQQLLNAVKEGQFE